MSNRVHDMVTLFGLDKSMMRVKVSLRSKADNYVFQ